MIIKDFRRYYDDFIYIDPKLKLLKKPFYYRLITTQKGKKRLLEIPFDEIKSLSKLYCELFQKIPCPTYNYAGYKGQSAYKNALVHIGNFAFVTIDIEDFYQNSKTKHVKDMLVNKFGINESEDRELLDFLLKILTYNGHIPTGAPASPILAFLTHKDLFDEIYEYTKALGITFTLYYDDITLSAKHGITMEVVKHICKILSKHGLKINPKKTKFYNYKKALITGYYVLQSGKISVPDHFGHDVIIMLKEKNITDMSKTELERLIGKITHIQHVNKKAFKVVKNIACKQLSKTVKELERKSKNEKNNN